MRRERGRGRGLVRYWLPVAGYLGLIFWFSSIGSLRPPSGLEFSDKLAHAAEYGLLAFLLIRALRGTGASAHTGTAALAALVLGLVVGLADELFQSTVPGREPDPADFAADAAGLVVGGFVFALYERLGGRRYG